MEPASSPEVLLLVEKALIPLLAALSTASAPVARPSLKDNIVPALFDLYQSAKPRDRL
jgi:hypothetical protein